ncbi:MAG: geranylgeranylglycerol-phosphate geranylgeranyltransferase [Methanotrichaceae archaeon]|nr:geranylgeranylglycerol-phosphate geranylgeranyltransferase [Methanotrichaceae archaeon]
MRAYWEILRPFNCMMAAAAAIIGLAIAGGLDPVSTALIFLAVFLITGAGNAINDYYDREIDAINRPARPIPSGRISVGAAFNYSLALFAVGCILAGLVNQICLAVAAFNSALLFLYARNLKATPLAGNICVAFLTGSTFLFGGAAAGLQGLQANQIPFMLSFLVSMSREIAKDIEDMAGDLQGGAQTLPIMAGERASAALAAAFALAAVVLGFFAPFGRVYLVIVAVADLFFLISVMKIARGDATGSQKALKKGMAVALVAFLAAALLQMNLFWI